MKKLSIILISVLVALAACTKSKEVHPEIGDGNDEIVTVGMKDVHVVYTRTDHAELQKVVFHYSLAELQQFDAAEMTERETFFELTLNDLLSDTLYCYYYELFPKGGNAFLSEQKTFRTQAFVIPEPPTPPVGIPEGAINGLFTINENGDQVYFSKGNLQYIGSANMSYWKFADNQWDNFGSRTGQGSDNENVDRDLFGWGTSGYNHGAVCYQPWSTSTNNNDYFAYGDASYHLYNQNGQADWGYNSISNGGNQSNQWRTLKREEWEFVINNRVTPSGVNYAKAKLNNVNGIILLPDNWNVSSFALSNTNSEIASFNDNIITSSQWNTLEQFGVVFLPAGGYRSGTSIISEGGTNGNYRSSTCGSGGDASYFTFDNTYVYPQHEDSRHYGFSVRLVSNNGPQPSITAPTVVTSYVSNVTSNTAQCSGEVTNDGGAEVTERGICWSTNANPTITNSRIVAGNGVGTFAATVTGLSASITYHVRAYATNEAGTAYGLDREFTTLEGGGTGEHEHVDLGLPSGTLWATCNVGANSPEEYGDYFAWGETLPKDYYDWGTYLYCMGSGFTLTKYCNNFAYGYNGFVDNLTTVLPEDDAATVNWGGDWRMPTEEDWQELYRYTTHEWTTQDGKRGLLLTASNGNSLFLPAAGWRVEGGLNEAGINGEYWSCSLRTDNAHTAWEFFFRGSTSFMRSNGRDYGFTVRPVRSGRKQ